ncbi:hypothetical protein B0H19DRAFT_1148435 [Mycena capillaripes]|nr:hypothetical protein B0H19DRAFT_1148435 [Mycena capillaripes]
MDSQSASRPREESATAYPSAQSPTTKTPWEIDQDKAVDATIAAHPGDERAQIDAIAEIRGYFRRGDTDNFPTTVVRTYMADDSISLEEVVRLLAEPIERTYTTADGGRLLVSEEKVARHQRPPLTSAAALEMWGPEEDLEALAAAVTDANDVPTTEGQLWELYDSILHEAKMTPWRDEAAQQRLVDLVAAIKQRADPPRPANMTVAASRNWPWVWAGGLGLWSMQILFGASARETWNETLGCGSGWHAPEVRAWTNLNAFVARLTVQGVRDFRLYGMWALREALEKEIIIDGTMRAADSVGQMADALFGVAAVWVQVAGPYIHDRLKRDDDSSGDITVTQWKKWHRKFTEETEKGRYPRVVTEIARECAELMAKIEGQGEDNSNIQ